MKTSNLLFSFLVCSLIFLSCDSGDEDAMDETMEDPDVIEEENPLPDQTSTFTTHVEPIINMYCSQCHGDPLTNGAPVMFITFDQVMSGVNERGLFDRISTTNPLNVMPPDGRLNQSDIDIIDDWIADGFIE